MRKRVLLACAIGAEVSATLSLKAALNQSAWYVVVAIGYLGSFALLDQVLRAKLPLGVAYGIWGAVGVALTAGLSSVIYDESLTATMIVGMALVIVGVLCIELGHQRSIDAAGAR